jgi:TonB family protein
MDQPDTGFAQRLAFAAVASLLVHALLLPEFSGGSLHFRHLIGSGLAPMRVSLRTIVPPAVPLRQVVAAANATDFESARLAASLAGIAPTRPAALSATPATEAATTGTDDPLPPVPAKPEMLDTLAQWPDESGFGPYRPITEVDVRPLPLVQIEPKYPENILPQVSGRALLLVMIGRDGLVDQVRVLLSEPGVEFGQNAKAAFEQARFTPAQVQGQSAPSYLTIEVNFG